MPFGFGGDLVGGELVGAEPVRCGLYVDEPGPLPPSGRGMAEQQRGRGRECSQPDRAISSARVSSKLAVSAPSMNKRVPPVAGQVRGPVGGFAAQHKALPDADVEEVL